MKSRMAALLLVSIFSLLAAPNTDAKLIRMPDRVTVYDTVLKVRWLANANLAGTPGVGLGSATLRPVARWIIRQRFNGSLL